MTAVQPWTMVPGARYRATEQPGEIEVQNDERSSFKQLGAIGGPLVGAGAGLGLAGKLGAGPAARVAAGVLGLGVGTIGATLVSEPEYGASRIEHVTPEQQQALEDHAIESNGGVQTGTTLAGASLAATGALQVARGMSSPAARIGTTLGAFVAGGAAGYGLGELVD